jgi:hypothetical protein
VPFWEVKEENPSHPWWMCESEPEQGKNVAFVVRERERVHTRTSKPSEKRRRRRANFYPDL